jgi:alkylation response protein AidB-like acyl-CoA dehydrogenase
MSTQVLLDQSLDMLLPAIRMRRAAIEQARRLPRDLVDELCATGIFSLAVPRAIGGREGSPFDIMRAIETIAAADGSTGWCAMVGVANNASAGYMPEAGAREVYADPLRPTAGIAAPAGQAVRVPGGVRVSGRWPFASGITHCEWLWAGCMVLENGQPRMTPHGPEIIHVCIPVAQVEVHDTWYVSGLSGTGSHDFSVRDVFVPEHRIFLLLDPAGHRPEPLFQLPALAWFVSQLACVSLGIARGALDDLLEIAQQKVPTMYQDVLAERPATQLRVARAETRLAAARALLYESVQALWDAMRDGVDPTARQIALNRAASIQAVETGAEVARTANTLAGGSAIFVNAQLQRHMRDAEVITHHFTVAPHVWEDVGRVVLGRAPAAAVF